MNDYFVKVVTTAILVIALIFIAYLIVYMKRDGRNMIEPPKMLAIGLFATTPIAVIGFGLISLVK